VIDGVRGVAPVVKNCLRELGMAGTVLETGSVRWTGLEIAPPGYGIVEARRTCSPVTV